MREPFGIYCNTIISFATKLVFVTPGNYLSTHNQCCKFFFINKLKFQILITEIELCKWLSKFVSQNPPKDVQRKPMLMDLPTAREFSSAQTNMTVVEINGSIICKNIFIGKYNIKKSIRQHSYLLSCLVSWSGYQDLKTSALLRQTLSWTVRNYVFFP